MRRFPVALCLGLLGLALVAPESRATHAGPTVLVGAISTTNPHLFANLNKFGEEFQIATNQPAGDWTPVNQFCSLLSIKWLLAGAPAGPYGISKFSKDQQIAMAKTLIAYNEGDGMLAQEAYAVAQLTGVKKTLSEATAGVKDATKYKAGTLIWAGNQAHVIAVHIKDDTHFVLYDSNNGTTTTHARADFGTQMSHRHCTAFVVHAK